MDYSGAANPEHMDGDRYSRPESRVGTHRRRRMTLGTVIAVLIAGALVGSLVTVSGGRWLPGAKESLALLTAGGSNRAVGEVSFVAGFAPVVRSAMPAVVNISSSKIVRNPQGGQIPPFFDDPFFRRFFGEGSNIPRERREQSLGSGVIVSPYGYILTNSHVVQGASDVKVSLSDNRELKARIIGTDPKTDIAVVQVDTRSLPTITLGDSAQVQVGDFALAIGNPFGIGQAVTMGIVSAVGRGNLGIEDYEDFIQTDAAINPGNSGGALINVRGELIGINTAIITRGSPGNQGVGFAVPINMARQVMEQLEKTGKVTRGYLGVMIQPITPAIAKAFGLTDSRGALVGSVKPGSPADNAGITKGDVILELNGTTVTDSRGLQLKISQTPPATTVHMKILRNGSSRDVSVRLGELPAEQGRAEGESIEPSGALEGLSVEPLTPEVRQQLGLPPRVRGVLVAGVNAGSRPAEAGLQRGDVIEEVNRQPVVSVQEFERVVRQNRQQTTLLLVNRGGDTLYVAIEPPG